MVDVLKLKEKWKSFNVKPLKHIYLIFNRGIYKLNLNEKNWIQQFNFGNSKECFFATDTFEDDIYISGGKNLHTDKIISNFESWNKLSKKIIKLPQMIESRSDHKLVKYKAKIYGCGGYENMGSTEVFDIESSKWTKGPKMNESKHSFGLISANLDDSIYAFGGLNTTSFSNIVERYDPREGNWNIISRDTPESSRSIILFNNSVYCFDKICDGNIFDLRKNSWNDSLVFNAKENFKYYSYNVVEFNNEIIGVFQTDWKTWRTYKYDHFDNTWVNLKISLNLEGVDDIRLCVISDA